MTIWVDAQLSPRTARWIAANFRVAAVPLRDLGLRDAGNEEIFAAARIADAIIQRQLGVLTPNLQVLVQQRLRTLFAL